MTVPLAAPGRFFVGEARAIRAAIEQVVASGSYVLGPHVAGFEREFASTIGPSVQSVGVVSGLDALTLSLRALALPERSHVLVPPNDGGFAALAASGAGLLPVQTDCDDSGLVGVEQLEQRVTPDTRAVVVTHLHGLVADVEAIAGWCRPRRIRVVEDCAQAHGAHGIVVHGDVAAFSFYPTKNLGALGDGGAVMSADTALIEGVRSLRSYGWGERFTVEVPGGRNSRLDEMQAAVLSARLPFLESSNELRRQIVARYRAAAPGPRFLSRSNRSFVAHHAVLVDPDRESLAALLSTAGIACAVHYPMLTGQMPGIALAGGHEAPTAAHLRDRILSLPCFPGMTGGEVDRVCEVLHKWETRRDR